MSMLRGLLAFVLALVFVVPVTAGNGGGNNPGGDGVWILPRSSVIVGLLPTAITPIRGTCHYPPTAQSLQMKVSPEVVSPVAFLVDPISGAQIPLATTVDIVTIPVSVINAFLAANVTTVLGTITDAAFQGYYFRLRIDPVTRAVDIDIF
jgi:hypothetical protein